MNDNDDFGPPIRMPGARRDPDLGIRRDSPPRSGPLQRGGRVIPHGKMIDFLAALLMILAAGGLLVCSGIIGHAIWDAIMLGWKIIG